MRRFVQAFGLKRDKHDPNQQRDTHKHGHQHPKAPLKALAIPFLSSSSLTTTTTESQETTATPPIHSPSSSSYSTPHLSSASSGPSSHSSGSSSGSASLSLQTPDDERNSLSLTRTDTKRSWKSWIGGKRSGSLRLRDRKDKDAPQKAIPVWDPPSLPIPPSLLTPTFQVTAIKDEPPDDDMHISSVSDLGYTPSAEGHLAATPTPADARRYLHTSIKNKLIPTVYAAPFVQPANGPIYPRSCNPSQFISGRPTLHSTLMRKQLLKRIDDHSQDLTPLELASILPFGSLPSPVELTPPPRALEFSIPYPDKSSTILSSCPGLRKWICRPCFEDRFVIYLASEEGQVDRKPVSSTHAVAALDYSEVLDVMVDPDFDLEKGPIPDPPSSPAEPVSPSTIKEVASKSSLQATSSSTSNPRRHSHTNTPSPLRNEHNPTGVAMPSASTSTPSPPLPPPQHDNTPKISPIPATSVKRVVRFVENDDDDDDGIPLHLLRMKKKREERSKFLRQERQRRMREAWEEQQRLEQEAAERERKRIVAEKEKKEREKRLYGEQVAASRQRREQSRAGAYAVSSSSSSSLLVPPLATSRDSERNRLQPSSYSSPRRETSEFGVQGSSSGGSPFSSRPASTYSASSEEVRPSSNSRRNSVTPSMTGSMRSMPSAMRTMTYPYPGWTGGGTFMPPMPQLAAFAAVNNDMPLLPPAAPFMKGSRQSSADSRDRRQSSGSFNSVSSRNHSSSSLSREPASPPSSHRQSDYRSSSHVRQGSHDSRHSKRSSTVQPRPPPSASVSSHSRGRPSLSHVQQAPSPWTALPSRSGGIPNAMPVSPYTHTQNRSSTFVGPMGHDWRSTLIS
ncbi:hypothetical protein BKA70DRAFT_556447 [Coprinopsis sp. MPI-PUGE-AT-0042]|nr:hypothetical protein BKA70DRAFT_556447 [Coprinopsis sp. MPI-PUGE-AT-0042]